MSDSELTKRLQDLQIDFENERGKRFANFFCPILRRDEPTELCRGHIVLKAFGISNIWVPQRKDIDNFYGSLVEEPLRNIVEDRRKSAIEIWLDPTLRKRHRPHLEIDGEKWEHYFPQHGSEKSPEHTRGEIVNEKNEQVSDVVFKVPAEVAAQFDNATLDVVVERDYRAAVVASMLKAAHLTMFRMLGYSHVFSGSGLLVADILGKFFDTYKTPKNVTDQIVEDYFLPHCTMVAPIFFEHDQVMRGTLEDNRLLSCISASNEVFAMGVVVPAGKDKFCVFLPTDKAIDVYFSFLKEQPPSIAARVTQFCRADERGGERWEIAPGDPIRIRLNQPLPE